MTIQKKLTTGQEIKIAYGLLIAAYVLMNLWAILSPSTWDDDCQGRFYSVQSGFENPVVLVDLWVRPLWALIFFLPVHLGPWVIPVIMALVSVSAAYALLKAAQIQGYKYIYLVVPFLLFQPYFFGVGRNAMTEPLAAALASWSFLLLLRQKWMWFAVLGSLLPLARLELSLLLVFWLIPLLQHKQWKYIPLLGAGILLLNLGGALLSGTNDWLWLYHQTVGGEVKDNPYGHQEFTTYFSRYLYIVGPVVFFLFLSGFVFRLINKKFSVFIDGQFIAGFLLYSIFAWKLDVGASAGFLRNLIPLSPFVAYIALAGFNHYTDWLLKKTVPSPYAYWLMIALTVLITVVFYGKQIELHHKLTENIDYWNISLAVITAFLLIILKIINTKQNGERNALLLSFIFSILIIIHSLVTEHPNANMSPERYAVTRTGELLEQYGLDKQKIHTGHYWLYWSMKLKKYDPRFVGNLRKVNVDSAKVGEIIVWEHHYSERFGNDLSQQALENDGTLVELLAIFADDGSFEVKVFKKVLQGEGINVLNDFISKNPESLEAIYARAVYASKTRQYAGALQDYNYLLSKRKKGYIYCSMANMYYVANDLQQALNFYNHALSYGDFQGQIHFYRGMTYQAMNNLSAACEDWIKADQKGIIQAAEKYNQFCIKK